MYAACSHDTQVSKRHLSTCRMRICAVSDLMWECQGHCMEDIGFQQFQQHFSW